MFQGCPQWVSAEVPIRSAKWLREAPSLDGRLGPVPFVEVHLCMMSFHLLQVATLQFVFLCCAEYWGQKMPKGLFCCAMSLLSQLHLKCILLSFANDAKPLKEFIMNDD